MRKSISTWLVTAFLGLSISAFAQEGEGGVPGNCGDGIDNDGDGFIDCFDKDCANVAECEDSYIGNDKSCQIPQPPGSDFRMRLKTESDIVTTTHGRFVIGDMGDLENGKDGIPEIVTAHGASKKLYILDGRTLEIKFQTTTPNAIERYDLAIADVKNNGCAQVFIAEEANESKNEFYISSYDCELNLLWRVKISGRPFTLALADFDHDGRAELYFRDQIHDAETGELLIAGSGNWTGIDGGPVAVDILEDDECAHCDGLELVLGGEIYSIDLNAPNVNDGGTRTLVRSFNDIPGLDDDEKWYPTSLNLGGDKFVNSQTSVADFDQDGTLDVLMTGITHVTTGNGKKKKTEARTSVFYWNIKKNTGKVFRPDNDWQYGAGRLNLADLDGDQAMNVAFVTGNRLYALDENLEEMWYVSIDENSSGYTSTTVFDFNNDGASEIVYRDETYLYIIKGDGTFSPGIKCKSLTSNDYPIVADVNADGATEICVICQENWNGDIYANADAGVIRMYESDNEPWVSARKVWNQHAYFNVNVNDDLTIPVIQQDHHVVFSKDECSDGENRVLNSFLNQSAILDSRGCKTFATADVAFEPDPELINIIPPTCPDTDFLVSFTIKNIGDVPLSGNLPISFYAGDPTTGAPILTTIEVALSNLEKDDTVKALNLTIPGTGGGFTLFAVLNDAGTTSPLSLPNSPFAECNYVNNIVSASVAPVPFALSAEITDHVQCGVTPAPGNGAAEVYKLEGTNQITAGYTFYWFNGSTAGAVGSEDFTGAIYAPLEPGTYTAYAVHDAFQCTSDTVSVTVGQEVRNITATVNVLHDFTNCFVPDGELEVIPDGGQPVDNFTYQWFEGTVFGTSPILSTSNKLTGAEALTYSVLITEKSSNCETLVSGAVPDQTIRPVVNATSTPTGCNPNNTGSVSADVGGIITGYTFSWYDGDNVKPSSDHTGDTYTGLTAGDYTVVAMDDNTGCRSIPFVVAVETPSGVTVTATIDAQQTSCADPNGAAHADVGGSTTGYTFQWFEGDNTIPPTIGTDATITGLAAGEYTVQATHVATGCTDEALILIEDQILTPTVSASVVAHQSTCAPANGEVTASAAGTPGPHEFYWFDGNVGGVLDTTAADFIGATYSGRTAGFYTVVAVNTITRCMSTREFVEVLDQTVTHTVATTVTDQSSCDAALPNGGASANVGGSTAGYRFRWFSGVDTTTFITEAVSISDQPAGPYMVAAINIATGCVATAPAVIDEVAKEPELGLTATDNTICNVDLDNDGNIDYNGAVTASFDTNPNGLPGHTYTYTWLKDGVPMSGETGPSISQLNGATYTVSVRNEDLHCESDPVSIDVVDDTDEPVLTTDQVASTNCTPSDADPNGQAIVLTVDGTPVAGATGYTYQWHTGTDDSTPISIGSNATADDAVLEGIQGGIGQNYTVKVTNTATGCEGLATVLVGDLSAKPVITLAATNNSICDPGIAGVPFNGKVEVATVTYKGAPFAGTLTYEWFDGAGTGTPNPSSTTATLVELPGGVYSARVTIEELGCVSNVVSATVNDVLAIPALTTTSVASTNCTTSVTPDGEARILTVDGAAPTTAGYTFQWHVGTDDSTPINISDNNTADDPRLRFVQGGPANNYTVKVTNTGNGCENTATVLVADASEKPVITVAVIDNTVCDPSLIVPGPGDYNGSAQVTSIMYKGAPYGGSSSLTYAWYEGVGTATPISGATSSTLSNLQAGSYSATLTIDDLGCTSNYVVAEVEDDFTLPAITTNVQGSTNCAGDPNGTADVINVLPAGPVYEFRWYAGTTVGAPGSEVNAGPTDPDVDKIQGGATAHYTVEVTSLADGCKNTATVLVPDISQKPVIASLDHKDNINCVNPNGEASIPAGAVTYRGNPVAAPYFGYTIAWNSGENTASIANKEADTYSVTITHDADGCTSDPVSVNIVDDFTYPTVATNVDSPQISCDPVNDPKGQLSAVETSGSGTYSIDWYAGVGVGTAGTELSETGTDGQTTPDLVTGDYTVRVTNTATGCETTTTVFLPENIVLPVAVVAATTPVTNCTLPNGEIEITPQNLTSSNDGDFTIWYLKENTTDPDDLKASGDQSQDDADFVRTGVGPGYWAVLLRDEITHCESQVVTVQVDDQTVAPQIIHVAVNPATDCDEADGDIDITLAPGAYTVTWYTGGPTNMGPYDFIDDGGTHEPTFGAMSSPFPIVAEDLNDVTAGLYTATVIDDATGCGTVLSEPVPFLDAPDVDIVTVNSQVCDVSNGNGSISVEVDGASIYTINVYFGSNPIPGNQENTSDPLGLCTNGEDDDSDGLIDDADPDCDGVFADPLTLTSLNLNPADYLIEVVDHQFDCNVYKTAIIEVDPLDPIVTINNVTANQACDLAFANGSVELTIEKDADDPRDPLTTVGYAYEITDITPAVSGTTPPVPVAANSVSGNTTIDDLEPTSYTIRVTETASGCFVDRIVNIPNQPAIPTIGVTVTNETYCNPNSNGMAQVTSAVPLALSEYDFEWYTDPALVGAPVHTGTGAAGQTIDWLTTPAAYALGAPGQGPGSKTYYVRAQQRSGAGQGCYSPVVQAIIQDKHATPQLALTPSPNTSCDPLIGEGSVSVTTLTNTNGTDPGVESATYTYSFTPDPNGVGVLNSQDGAVPTLIDDELTHGVYTVTAVNEESGCAVSADVQVLEQRFTIAITNADVNDKLICFLDGDIAVTDITIDRSLKGLADLDFTTPLSTDFEFRWFKNVPGLFTTGSALQDGTATVIDTETLIVGAGAGEYQDPAPTLGAGVYYVVARKLAGTEKSGVGCETLPFRVEIKDKSVDPVISLTAFSNTSCDPTVPEGEIEMSATDASDPSVVPGGGFNYDYTWTSLTSTKPGNGTFDGNAMNFGTLDDGTYEVTVTNTTTGCVSTLQTTIEPNSTPIFVQDVDSSPQFSCAPAGGSLEVTEIIFHDRNGSSSNAPLGDFTFTWYRNGNTAGNQLPGVTGSVLDSTNYAAIGADNDYYVVATRNANGPGRGCSSAPFRVEIVDKRVYPVIVLTPFANTSCDPALFEGEIEVDVTDASIVASTYTYDYHWTPLSGTVPPAPTLGNDGVDNVFGGLQEGTYQLEAVNTVTGCSSTLQTTIQPNATPIFVQTVLSTPQHLCVPSGNLEVTQISYNDRDGVTQNVAGGGLSDFTFTWYRGGTAIANVVGGNTSVLDSAVTNYPGIGADANYYVVATRVSNAPGYRCSSAPYRVEIKDQRKYPTLTFATVSNTSCDNNFDGEITVTASTAGLGAGSNYSFDWMQPSLADNLNTASPYQVMAAEPATYNITVTNLFNQCARTGQVTVSQRTPTIEILGVTKIDQTDCAPANGSITIDGTDAAHVTVPGTYTFTWTRNGVPVATPTPDNILADLDAATYTITATKTDNTGSGCVSAAFPVVIKDLTQTPVIELVNTANFACVAPFNGEILATVAEGTTSGVTAGYEFEWFLGSGTGLPMGVTTNVLTAVEDGTYTVEVIDQAGPNLGCVSTATTVLQFAPTVITGEILPTMQTLCPPSQNGSLEVDIIQETISGVTTTYNMSNPVDLARYTFEWLNEDMTPIAGFTSNVLPNRLAGTYHLQITNALGCQSTFSTSVILDENAYPVITLDDFMNPTLCVLPEGPGHLQVSADNTLNFSDYTFEWFEGPDATGALVEANNPGLSNIFYNDPLEYTVRVTNLLTNCQSLETYRFETDTVNIRALASAVSLNSCIADNGRLFAAVQEGNGNLYNYEWYAGTSVSGTPVFTTKDVLDAPLGVFTVIAINPNHSFCKSIPATAEVTDGRIYPDPEIEERNPLTYCDPAKPNGVARVTVNGQIVGYTFDWYVGPVSGTPFYTGAEVSGLTDILYTVEATDQVSGCTGTETITISNDPVDVPEPTVQVISHETHCLVPNGELKGTAVGGSWQYTIQWYNGSSVRNQTDAEGQYYRGLAAGLYTTTALDLISGCVSDPVTTEVLEMMQLPEFEIETTPTNCEANVGTATLVPTDNLPLEQIEWNIGGMLEYGPIIMELPKGEFTVRVTSTQKCQSEKTFIIEPEILVFNGISADGDGNNDFFEISCIQDFPNNIVKIFNRAGTLVYQAKGYDNQNIYFNGVSNEGLSLLGRELPEGTYFYIIDKGDGSVARTGYLELLRQ